MGGTKAGGKAAAATNKQKYGSDFYHTIGKKAADAYKAIPQAERKPRGMAYLKLHNPQRLKEISSRGGRRTAGKVSDD